MKISPKKFVAIHEDQCIRCKGKSKAMLPYCGECYKDMCQERHKNVNTFDPRQKQNENEFRYGKPLC